MNKRNNYQRRVRREDKHRINRYIRESEVRLVGDNVPNDVYPIKEALEIAEEQGLDLVEISTKAEPHICKVVEYKKFLYDQEKKKKELEKKSRQKNKDIKEIRFTSNTGEHDVDTKKKKICDFLKNGHKVKLNVLFKGRNITHKERGELLLLKIAESLSDISKPENMPKMEGKNMLMMLTPKKSD